MDYSAIKRLVEQLTRRLDALTTAFQQSQRPKPTSWVQNGAGGGTGLAKSPSGGIPARSSITVGVATCTLAELYDDSGTIKIREKSPTVEVEIYNTTGVAVSGTKWIHWKTDGDYKIVDVDDCA